MRYFCKIGVWITILSICWGIFLYCYGFHITGPFIFGDESTYFSFAKDIFNGKNLESDPQYGPLYPALIAPLFWLNNVVETYQVLRILNIILFISSAIPAYWLTKELFTHQGLRFLLPFCVLISPFSGLVFLVWAEPLYIGLFYWTYFFFILFVKKPGIIRGITFGVLLSSLYYAKPGAGLVIQVAALLSFVAMLLDEKIFSRMKLFVLSLLSIGACVVVELPWMLHYSHMKIGIIGYGPVIPDFYLKIVQFGYLSFLLKVLSSLFYQFSYVFVGSWGLVGIGVFILVTHWHILSRAERNGMTFLILSIVGLIVLCALGVSSISGLDYRLPDGRYFSALFPLMIVFVVHLLFKVKSMKVSYGVLLVVVLFVTVAIAFIATPLYVRNPLVFNSIPELAPIIFLSDHHHMIWRELISEPPMLWRWGIPLFFGLFAGLVILLRHQKYGRIIAITMIAIGVTLSALAEQFYMHNEGNNPLNDVYRYFITNKISSDQIVFDEQMETGSNAPFLSVFWFGKAPVYQAIGKEELIPRAKVLYLVSRDSLALPKIFFAEGYFIYKFGNESVAS